MRSRPQYETIDAGSFLIATKDGGCANDGTGDQAGCINTFLENANAAGQIAYFPAGIYQVGSTVFVPTGSRIQGASWSQIQGAGIFFSDLNNPQVMVTTHFYCSSFLHTSLVVKRMSTFSWV